MRRKYIGFILIFLLAFFLRFWNIETNPPGIHADEADSAYNAYSILKTGKDIYGNFLPLQITGFAHNYRAPLSTYITIPFVATFGLSNIAIRMPAVILGTLFVLLMYFILKYFFKSEAVGFIGAFIAAVNPWAVHISRAYADHILALDFVLLGTLLVLLKKKNVLVVAFAGISFGLSLFSYHAPKIFLPLFIPLFVIFFKDFLWGNKKYLAIFLISFGAFYLFMINLSLFSGGATELGNVSFINNDSASKIINKERRVTNASLFVSSIFHNKPLFYTKELLRNYGKIFSINYLYLDGESNLTAWIGDRGVFYPIELPLLLIGIYFIVRKHGKLSIFLLLWAIIAALPSAITQDQMYTYRGIYLLPVFLIFTSFGIYSIYKFMLKTKLTRLIFIILISILYSVSIISFYFHYFYDFPVYSRKWWAAEDHDAMNYVINNRDKYEAFYVDGGVDWVLLYAYYTKFDPFLFQEALRNLIEINNVKFVKIDKLNVGAIAVTIKKNDRVGNFFPKNSLYIGRPDQFPLDNPVYKILSKEDWGTIYKMFVVK